MPCKKSSSAVLCKIFKKNIEIQNILLNVAHSLSCNIVDLKQFFNNFNLEKLLYAILIFLLSFFLF